MRCFLSAMLAIFAMGASAVEIYRTGSTADRSVDWQPALLLAGGGGDVAAACARFLRCAEGGDVVVLRASGSDGYNDFFYRELGVPLNAVTSIVFHSRDDASNPEVLQLIRNAECVFVAGGDQAKYHEYWQQSEVAEALQDHIDAGKPIGGSSAGLAILGQKAYLALHPGSLDSTMALQNPFHPYVTLRTSFVRIPMLGGILTDSHFMDRNRLGRLLVFLARIQEPDRAPEWIGLGVDEGTALFVDGDGQGTVYRNGPGQVHLVSMLRVPDLSSNGNSLWGASFQLTSLGSTSSLHLPTLEVTRPESVSIVEVEGGELRIAPQAPLHRD